MIILILQDGKLLLKSNGNFIGGPWRQESDSDIVIIQQLDGDGVFKRPFTEFKKEDNSGFASAEELIRWLAPYMGFNTAVGGSTANDGIQVLNFTTPIPEGGEFSVFSLYIVPPNQNIPSNKICVPLELELIWVRSEGEAITYNLNGGGNDQKIIVSVCGQEKLVPPPNWAAPQNKIFQRLVFTSDDNPYNGQLQEINISISTSDVAYFENVTTGHIEAKLKYKLIDIS